MMISKKLLTVFIISSATVLNPAFAGTGDISTAGSDNNRGNDNNGGKKKVEAPFDGGLTLLLAAGAGLGLKAAYRGKKKDTSK